LFGAPDDGPAPDEATIAVPVDRGPIDLAALGTPSTLVDCTGIYARSRHAAGAAAPRAPPGD
jgi:hypothetical protein